MEHKNQISQKKKKERKKSQISLKSAPSTRSIQTWSGSSFPSAPGFTRAWPRFQELLQLSLPAVPLFVSFPPRDNSTMKSLTSVMFSRMTRSWHEVRPQLLWFLLLQSRLSPLENDLFLLFLWFVTLTATLQIITKDFRRWVLKMTVSTNTSTLSFL